MALTSHLPFLRIDMGKNVNFVGISRCGICWYCPLVVVWKKTQRIRKRIQLSLRLIFHSSHPHARKLKHPLFAICNGRGWRGEKKKKEKEVSIIRTFLHVVARRKNKGRSRWVFRHCQTGHHMIRMPSWDHCTAGATLFWNWRRGPSWQRGSCPTVPSTPKEKTIERSCKSMLGLTSWVGALPASSATSVTGITGTTAPGHSKEITSSTCHLKTRSASRYSYILLFDSIFWHSNT